MTSFHGPRPDWLLVVQVTVKDHLAKHTRKVAIGSSQPELFTCFLGPAFGWSRRMQFDDADDFSEEIQLVPTLIA